MISCFTGSIQRPSRNRTKVGLKAGGKVGLPVYLAAIEPRWD